MAAEQLAELKQLEAAATPGPWEYQTSNSVRRIGVKGDSDGNVMHGEIYLGVPDIAVMDVDAKLIVALRNHALKLIVAVEECDQLKQRLAVCAEYFIHEEKNWLILTPELAENPVERKSIELFQAACSAARGQ